MTLTTPPLLIAPRLLPKLEFCHTPKHGETTYGTFPGLATPVRILTGLVHEIPSGREAPKFLSTDQANCIWAHLGLASPSGAPADLTENWIQYHSNPKGVTTHDVPRIRQCLDGLAITPDARAGMMATVSDRLWKSLSDLQDRVDRSTPINPLNDILRTISLLEGARFLNDPQFEQRAATVARSVCARFSPDVLRLHDHLEQLEWCRELKTLKELCGYSVSIS